MNLHFYSRFPVYWPLKVLYNTRHIHPFIHTLMAEAVMQGVDHQEQFVAQYVAQGYFHMQPGESNLFPSDYWTTHSASWATATQRLTAQLFYFLPSLLSHILRWWRLWHTFLKIWLSSSGCVEETGKAVITGICFVFCQSNSTNVVKSTG